MNIGLYQSASSLSALERWQDAVAQNIASGQMSGYRKRTVSFSTQAAGEIQNDPKGRIGRGDGQDLLFPKVSTGVNFLSGETEPTNRQFDVAIQGDGFFQVQNPDGTMAYTRDGGFRMSSDRTLVNAAGQKVMSEAGTPVTLVSGQGDLIINQDGSMAQGTTSLGKLSVVKFADNNQLTATVGGAFVPSGNMVAQPIEKPQVLQGYLEGSNVAPLREMVDLVVISRAYEANQKMITSVDEQMQKTLDALG